MRHKTFPMLALSLVLFVAVTASAFGAEGLTSDIGTLDKEIAERAHLKRARIGWK